MRAVQFDRFGGPDVLHIVPDAPDPVPGPGEVLVRVLYAGLNPLDFKIRDGSSGRAKGLALPAGTGRELVGEVVGHGPDAPARPIGITATATDEPGDPADPPSALPVGTRVFGMRGEDSRGTCAELVAIPATQLAPVPDRTADAELPRFAGLALVGLTALSAVIDPAHVHEGDTVLVHGGTGGVGQMVLPLAREEGAAGIWATGRGANADRIRELGAEPIPYDQDVDWQERILAATGGRGPDVIIDTHYLSTFLPGLEVLAPGGRMVVLPTLADLTPARERGIDASIPTASVSRERLDRLAAGLTDGRYPLEVSEVVPMAQIARAHALLEGGHTRGKLVLDLR
jgi:NADPH2:quinone reductase